MTIVLSSSADKVHTFICLLFALCSFWPFIFILHPTVLEQSGLQNALVIESSNINVVSFRSTSLLAFSLLAPFFLDFCTEVFIIDRSSKQTSNIKKKDDEALLQYMNHYEKSVFIIGLFVVPMVAFVSPMFDELALLWLCMSRFQIITVVGILRVSLYRIDEAIHSHSFISPWWSHLWFTTILALTVNFSTWTAIYGTHSNIIQLGIDMALKVMLLVMLILPFGRWLLHRFQHYKLFRFFNQKTRVQDFDTAPSMKNPKRGSKSSGHPFVTEAKSAVPSGKLQETLYFSTLYIIFGFVFIILIIVLLMIKSEDEFTSTYLTTYNIWFVVIELFLLYYDLRKNKYDSRCHLLALVESRKQYLRYIAHEMRTPLNSAVLGLQVLPHSSPIHPFPFPLFSLTIFLAIVIFITYS